MDDLKLISRAEAALLLDVSERTLQRMEAAGTLEPVRIGSAVKYAVKDIRDFIERSKNADSGKEEEKEADVRVHSKAPSRQD